MTRERFLDYLLAYNQDRARLADFYTQDLAFENATMTLSLSEIEEFFSGLRDKLVDTIEPIQLIVDEAGVALFGRHKFEALSAVDLPIGSMRQGDVKTLGLFGFYETRGERISRIRISYWPDSRVA